MTPIHSSSPLCISYLSQRSFYEYCRYISFLFQLCAFFLEHYFCFRNRGIKTTFSRPTQQMHSRFGMSNRNRIIGSLSLRRLYNGMGNPNSAAMMTIPMMMMMKKNTSGALREQRQQKLNNSHPTIRHFYKNVMQLDSNGNAETVDGKQKPQCLLIDGTPLVVRAFHGTKVNMVKYVCLFRSIAFDYIRLTHTFL